MEDHFSNDERTAQRMAYDAGPRPLGRKQPECPGERHGVPPYAIGSTRWPGLAKLTEECGELLQVAGKLMAYPEAERHPDGSVLDLRLHEEMAHVIAAIEFVIESNGRMAGELVESQRMGRLERFRRWHHDERFGGG